MLVSSTSCASPFRSKRPRRRCRSSGTPVRMPPIFTDSVNVNYIGVVLGDRRKILRAIAKLDAAPEAVVLDLKPPSTFSVAASLLDLGPDVDSRAAIGDKGYDSNASRRATNRIRSGGSTLFLQQDGRTCKRLADRKQMPPIEHSLGWAQLAVDAERTLAGLHPCLRKGCSLWAVSLSKGVPITNKRGAAGAAPRSFSERKSFAFFKPRELCGREGNHAIEPRAPRSARCFLYSPATGTCARVTIRPRFVFIIH